MSGPKALKRAGAKYITSGAGVDRAGYCCVYGALHAIGSDSEKLAIENGNSFDDLPLLILRSNYSVVDNG